MLEYKGYWSRLGWPAGQAGGMSDQTISVSKQAFPFSSCCCWHEHWQRGGEWREEIFSLLHPPPATARRKPAEVHGTKGNKTFLPFIPLPPPVAAVAGGVLGWRNCKGMGGEILGCAMGKWGWASCDGIGEQILWVKCKGRGLTMEW